MLLSVKKASVNYRDFGILLPVAPDRPSRIIQALREDPALGPRESEWLIEESPAPLTQEDLLLVHSREYVNDIFSNGLEERLIQSYELRDPDGNPNRYDPSIAVHPLTAILDRHLVNAAASTRCCKLGLELGFCFYFGGGGHHGHSDFGHGFCLLNDILLGARITQRDNDVNTVWIIDVDVHKGDGTAAVTRNDPSIITLSAHMAAGWPLDLPGFLPDGTPHPSYIASNIDIPIKSGEEAEYNPRLLKGLETLSAFPRPDLAIVVSGADPYEKDELLSTNPLNLTLDQLFERDMMIYTFLKEQQIPMAYLMAGGYGEHAWEPYPPFLKQVLKERMVR